MGEGTFGVGHGLCVERCEKGGKHLHVCGPKHQEAMQFHREVWLRCVHQVPETGADFHFCEDSLYSLEL